MYKTTAEIYLMPESKLVEREENPTFSETFEGAFCELDCCSAPYEGILARGVDAPIKFVISLFWVDEENQSRLLAHKELKNYGEEQNNG